MGHVHKSAIAANTQGQLYVRARFGTEAIANPAERELNRPILSTKNSCLGWEQKVSRQAAAAEHHLTLPRNGGF